MNSLIGKTVRVIRSDMKSCCGVLMTSYTGKVTDIVYNGTVAILDHYTPVRVEFLEILEVQEG